MTINIQLNIKKVAYKNTSNVVLLVVRNLVVMNWVIPTSVDTHIDYFSNKIDEPK